MITHTLDADIACPNCSVCVLQLDFTFKAGTNRRHVEKWSAGVCLRKATAATERCSSLSCGYNNQRK